MHEEQLKEIAAQLRKPQGEAGLITADMMNKGNFIMHKCTFEMLEVCAGDCILEIGMGNGFFVKELFNEESEIQYIGCDYSELMIEEATKLNAAWIAKDKVKFIQGDVAALPFAAHSFNKVFTINTIYFWEDTVHVVNEIKRVLQEDGVFLITFRPKHYIEKYPFIKYGFNQFKEEDVVDLLSANGFYDVTARVNKEPDFEVNGEVMKMENVIVSGKKR